MTKLTEISLSYPRTTLLVLLAVTIGFAAGLPKSRTDIGYRAYLGAEHPEVQKLDAFVERFGGGLPIVIVWTCEGIRFCETVFDRSALEMAYSVSRDLERFAGVQRVESPATSVLSVPSQDGFDMRQLVVEGVVAPDAAALAERARMDPIWVGNLISEDARVGAIVVELPSTDTEKNEPIFRAILEAVGPYEAEGIEFKFLGEFVELSITETELATDTARLIPLAVVIIGVIVFLQFRSAVASAYALLVVGLSLVWAQGLMAWLGWPQSTLSNTMPPLILVIGVCDAVHFLSRYSAHVARGLGHSAVLSSARDVAVPCLMTSITTAVGLFSFAFADVQALVHLGVVASFGVMVALLLTFTLLPTLLHFHAPRLSSAQSNSPRWSSLERMVAVATQRSGLVLGCSLLVAGVAAVGASKVRADVKMETLYGTQSKIVQWWRFAEQNLREPDTLELSIRLPDHSTAESPDVLRQLEEFSQFLVERDGLKRVTSILDPLGWTRRLLHDDVASFQGPAPSEEENAEILLLLSMQHEGALAPWVTLDQRSVRISIQATDGFISEKARVRDQVDSYIESSFPEDWTVEVTGSFWMSTYLNQIVQRTQLQTFAFAAVLVFTLVAVFMRSALWGAVAMVPTLFPVLVVLGVMGFAEIPLDTANAMIAAVIVGIAIDDAIHLLSRFRVEKNAGANSQEAVLAAISHAGRAIVITSVALSVGFLSLAISSWQSIANFGWLTALAILSALVADLILLPAMMSFRTAAPALDLSRELGS